MLHVEMVQGWRSPARTFRGSSEGEEMVSVSRGKCSQSARLEEVFR